MIKFILLFCGFLLSFSTFAQKNHARFDSLLQVLKTEKSIVHDNTFKQICLELDRISKYEYAIVFGEKLVETAEEIKNKKLLICSYYALARIYETQNNIVMATNSYWEAYQFCEENKLKIDQAKTLQLLSELQLTKKRDAIALEYLLEASDIYQSIGFQKDAAECFYKIAHIHYHASDHIYTMDYLHKVIEFGADSIEKRTLINSYNTIGLVYRAEKKYSQAMNFHQKALNVAIQCKDSVWIGIAGGNIGIILQIQGQNEEALKFLEIDSKLSIQYQEWGSAVTSFVRRGDIYHAQKNDIKAKIYYDSALNLSIIHKTYDQLSALYGSLASYYYNLKDFQKAYDFQVKHTQIQDSLDKRRYQTRIADIQTSFEADKKQAEIDFLKKNSEKDHVIIERQSFMNYIILAILTGITFSFLFLLRSNREKRIANELLNQSNNEILAQKDKIESQKQIIEKNYIQTNESIRYAQQIQTVILPEDHKLANFFSEFFIIFKPKDVVSGDFYWFQQISEQNAIFALVDCTGHGVPGAFMSMVGNTLLHETINIKKVSEPARILRNLYAGVRNLLKQKEGKNTDGMDIALCLFEKRDETTKITFAGAKTSIFYLENNVIQMVSGDRISIGGRVERTKEFENHEMILPSKTSIYFFSDGFTDQNNELRKSFGTNRLRMLVSDLSNLTFEQQKIKMLEALKKHQGNEAQRDDISFIALRT
ncbi:MAG: hypothetical protein EAZ97_09555 [Bacteroidetes bacterium]|nr:MAG: hypothetical protein EAZ97_09555 [Bacteroidota bacterium]